MKKKARIVSSILTFTIAATMLAGCGGSKTAKAGKDTTFSWWIYSGADSSYYTEYSENPAVQYSLTKGWGDEQKGISFEFWQPASGTSLDNYSTMIASGDLPDIIDAVVSDPPSIMCEKGYALDITEYVEAYMPNYVALVHSNDSILKNTVTVKDGEEHYYYLANIQDKPETVFQGYMYRRDWIVKYGTNPETGAAFTGGYTDPENVDSWEDDVVFPSGETNPVYISDWEWMFDIFTKAQADLGIDDSYCLSLYYPGFTWSGGLVSSFGGGTNVWSQDVDGKVRFGGDSIQFRTYLECMNSWYEKGWLDKNFNERTSDAFYAIDSTSVRQGKVGMWNGQQSELGGRIDAHDGGLTDGMYVAGCAYPINDIYGPEECKNCVPDCVMGGEIVSGGVLITPTAKDKDLATLFSYFDYFYSEEGALLRTLGLSKEQVDEFSANSFYADYGLENGAYSIGDDGKYVKSDVLVNDSGNLLSASRFEKAPGLTLVENVDLGYEDNFQASLDEWGRYENTGFFQGSITTNSMTPEDGKFCDELRSKLIEFMTNNAVDFIKGSKDINSDSDWENWCKTMKKYNYQKATDIYQIYVDEHPFR